MKTIKSNTSNLISLAKEAVEIGSFRKYINGSGAEIILQDQQPSSFFSETVPLDITKHIDFDTEIEINQKSILQSLYDYREEYPCALNFASAKRPGGGFLSGAVAQEESLARASTLYESIKDSPFYKNHVNALYSHDMIYSPDVWVFRNDFTCGKNSYKLDNPYKVAIITATAVNQNALKFEEYLNVNEIMLERSRRVLEIAIRNNHKILILGAWGCGAFGNQPEIIAAIFKYLLSNWYKNSFEKVVFPIFGNGNNYSTFKKILTND